MPFVPPCSDACPDSLLTVSDFSKFDNKPAFLDHIEWLRLSLRLNDTSQFLSYTCRTNYHLEELCRSKWTERLVCRRHAFRTGLVRFSVRLLAVLGGFMGLISLFCRILLKGHVRPFSILAWSPFVMIFSSYIALCDLSITDWSSVLYQNKHSVFYFLVLLNRLSHSAHCWGLNTEYESL
jgi:hypothetical protein